MEGADPAQEVAQRCRTDNRASQRAFAKAGFRSDRPFDDVPNGLHLLMVRERLRQPPYG